MGIGNSDVLGWGIVTSGDWERSRVGRENDVWGEGSGHVFGRAIRLKVNETK